MISSVTECMRFVLAAKGLPDDDPDASAAAHSLDASPDSVVRTLCLLPGACARGGALLCVCLSVVCASWRLAGLARDTCTAALEIALTQAAARL